ISGRKAPVVRGGAGIGREFYMGIYNQSLSLVIARRESIAYLIPFDLIFTVDQHPLSVYVLKGHRFRFPNFSYRGLNLQLSALNAQVLYAIVIQDYLGSVRSGF